MELLQSIFRVLWGAALVTTMSLVGMGVLNREPEPAPPSNRGFDINQIGLDYANLVRYTREFYQLAGPNTRRVRIIFGRLRPGHLGVTLLNDQDVTKAGGFLVLINTLSWEKMSDLERRSLVFHELGHAVLGRDHFDGYLPDKCPVTVMATYSFPDDCLTKHKDYYDKELFDNRNL